MGDFYEFRSNVGAVAVLQNPIPFPDLSTTAPLAILYYGAGSVGRREPKGNLRRR